MKYDNKTCNKFVEDMKKAGLEIEHYHGRFFWEGPAVRVDDIQDAMSNTKVELQWDHMGLSFIVYPKQSGKLIEQMRQLCLYCMKMGYPFEHKPCGIWVKEPTDIIDTSERV